MRRAALVVALGLSLALGIAAPLAAQEADEPPAPGPAAPAAEPATAPAGQEAEPATTSTPAAGPVVQVFFEGNDVLSDGELRRGLVDPLLDVTRRGGRRADVDDAAYELQLLYLERGHAFARVGWRREEPAAGRVVVTFEVTEGPQVVLRTLSFEGNEALPDATLAKLYDGPSSGFLGRGDRLYVESDVDALGDDLLRSYRLRGYADAAVSEPRISFSPDRTAADVAFTLEEGPAYELAGVSFEGNERVPDEVIARAAEPVVGQPFRRRVLYELRARVEAALKDRGFASARVEVVEDSRGPTGLVTARVRMEEGVQVRIGAIRVEGPEDTDEEFIRDRIPFEPGQVWIGALHRQLSRELLATGLFRSVEVELEGEGEVRDLVVRVEDAKSIELYVKPGYGRYEKARMSVGIRENNLFGSGRAANFEVGASTKSEFADLVLSDPWILGDGRTLGMPISYLRREEPSFTERTRSIGLHVRKRYTRELSAMVGTEYRRSTVSDVDADVADDIQENSKVASVFGQLRHDTRDQIFNPLTGHVATGFLEYAPPAFGTDLEFVRLETAAAKFIPVTDHLVLAGSVRSAFIVPAHSTDEIPLQERYFNGGENNVRSFQRSELGPKDDDGDPVGGEVANTLNLEARYNWTNAWQTALFFDYGNVGLEFSDYFDDFREGVGAGVRYLLPVGSVRLDVAWNPSVRSGEDHWVTHLSIGMAF